MYFVEKYPSVQEPGQTMLRMYLQLVTSNNTIMDTAGK